MNQQIKDRLDELQELADKAQLAADKHNRWPHDVGFREGWIQACAILSARASLYLPTIRSISETDEILEPLRRMA